MRAKYIVMGILAVFLGFTSLGMTDDSTYGEEGSQTDATYSDASYSDATYTDASSTDIATLTNVWDSWDDKEENDYEKFYKDDGMKDKDNKPATGDRADILMYVMLLAISGVFIVRLCRSGLKK